MKITRIKPPKYKNGRYSLNEYELRQLMLEVAKGEKQSGQTIKDLKGNSANIQPDGSLTYNLFGTDIMTCTTMNMLKIRKIKK